ncbi:MAG: hypothetical protein WCI21_01240 [Alphaproteobacteria bacterium]
MIALLLLALAADPVIPAAPEAMAVPGMPCELGSDALKATLAETPGIRHAPFPRPNAFDTYYDDAHTTIYFATTLGQPGDPAVVRVIVTNVNGTNVMTPSACNFGDKTKTQELFNMIKALMDPKAVIAAPAAPADNAPAQGTAR